MAIQYNRIWIESESGRIFFNEDASTCTVDCWVEVAEMELIEEPEQPNIEGGDVIFEDITLSRRIPVKGVIDTKSQQGNNHVAGITYAFALTEDGLIYLLLGT